MGSNAWMTMSAHRSPSHLARSLFLLSAVVAAASALSYHSPVLYARAESLQQFNSTLGGAAPPIVPSTDSARPFAVEGDTFPTFSEAASRTCDVQLNECNRAANAQGNKGTLKLADCTSQKETCLNFQKVAPKQKFDAGATSNAATSVAVAAAPPPPPAAAAAAAPTSLAQAALPEFLGADPNDPDFDLFCDP